MAIEKYQFLNEAGVQKLAADILTKVNSRIAERIVTAVDETSNDKHVASAKALYDLKVALEAIDNGLAGRIDDHDTTLGTHGDSIAALETSQGEQDTRMGTIEGDLSALQGVVDALTHLTIDTVVGDISTVADPQTDVLYFQKDDEADPSWNLYIYQAPATEGEQGTWIAVGDTEIDLSGYWAKDETSVAELREALAIHDAEALPDATISTQVDTAYTATAPDLT